MPSSHDTTQSCSIACVDSSINNSEIDLTKVVQSNPIHDEVFLALSVANDNRIVSIADSNIGKVVQVAFSISVPIPQSSNSSAANASGSAVLSVRKPKL